MIYYYIWKQVRRECWGIVAEPLENERSQNVSMTGHCNTVISWSLTGGSESYHYKNYFILKMSITRILLRVVKCVYYVLNVLCLVFFCYALDVL